MAKDSKSTFQIIDDEGCPVDPTIFPGFTPEANALQSVYEAFRFTESYGVIFQCNVKYCLGPCEPAVCEWGRDSLESWGRKRRSIARYFFLTIYNKFSFFFQYHEFKIYFHYRLHSNETQENDEETNISQEILVLDFGDEKSEFLRSGGESDFNGGKY